MAEIFKAGAKVELVSVKKSFTAKDGDEISYMSQVIDETADGMICAMPIFEGRLIPLDVGDNYDIYVYGTVVYKVNATVASRGKEGNIYTAVFKFNSEPKKFQRRSFYRLECMINTEVKVISSEDAEKYKKNKELPADILYLAEDDAIIKDISGGGAKLLSQYSYKRLDNCLLRFNISYSGNTHKLEVLGRVKSSVSNDKLPDKNDVGIQFIEPSAAMQDLLVKYIFEQQRLMRKKENS